MGDFGFEILYHEGPCLAVCKPPGLLTQAPPGIDSLEARIKDFFRQRENKSGNVYLGIPHRLDRPASGAMVFARHSRAARRLAEQFEGRLVRKVYWACVQGTVEPAEGTWTDMIRKIPDEPRAEMVPRATPTAAWRCSTIALSNPAPGAHGWRSCWKPAACTRSASSRPRAPIRCSATRCMARACPSASSTRMSVQRAIALHARSLSFRHPMTREPVTVTAPVPKLGER